MQKILVIWGKNQSIRITCKKFFSQDRPTGSLPPKKGTPKCEDIVAKSVASFTAGNGEWSKFQPVGCRLPELNRWAY